MRSVKGALAALGRGFKRRLKSFVFAAISAVALIFANYMVDSSPYPMGNELEVSQWIEYFRRIDHQSVSNVPDSVCLINVAFDKVLVDYEAPLYADGDSETLPAGTVAITDRLKLYDFLSVADSLKSYRYILLDVRFDEDIPDDSISAELFSLIAGMENIVFARHGSTTPAEEAPLHKAALSDFYTTLLSPGVVKFPLLTFSSVGGEYEPSIPTKMFTELHHSRFTTCGPLTFIDGKLSTRAVYPTFPVRLEAWAVYSPETDSPRLMYRNLGEDILSLPQADKAIESLIENRIVVVGDFADDVHSTFIGTQPGALINLNSYIALCRGAHLVNWAGVLLQFLLYFSITWCILSHVSLFRQVGFLQQHRFALLRFLLSFIGFSFVLILASALVYISFGVIWNIVLPSAYFSILQSCVKKES